MSKFSQGKWRCEWDDNKYIWGANDEVIGELYFTTPEETKANARLIAAAPEMYQKLKSAVSYCSYAEEFSPAAKIVAKSIKELLARIDGD